MFKHKWILIFIITIYHQINTKVKAGSLTFIGAGQANKCNYLICPSEQGFCKADKCFCLEGYLTVQNDKTDKYCNYKQKNIITALLLETFGLIGFGHLYAGRVFYGLLKLFCFYIIICYGSQFVIQFMKENTDSDIAYYIKLGISIICIGTPLVWHFIDLFNWANNNYKDGNGLPLLDW